jgi:membrane associated rhomboid family serine protease
MFIPYSTDANLYHLPITTVTLIIINVLVFVATAAHPDAAAQYILVFGDGIHPTQWITCCFLHGGIMHLVGNMFFLWAFGLIVEGRLGWWKMLAVYLVICAIYGLLTQLLMLGAAPLEGYGALGASGAIFALMAMCLIWTPENTMACIQFFWGLPSHFEMKVFSLVGLFLVLQLVFAGLSRMTMGSEVLHLIGAIVGFPIAIILLKTGQVDCEYWDIFSIWAGRNRMSRDDQAKLEAEAEVQEKQRRDDEIQRAKQNAALEQIRQILADGNPSFAAKAHQQMQKKLPGWTLPTTDLLNIIQALHEKSLWSDSIPLMEEYIERHPDNEPLVRLKLVQILLHEKQPSHALQVIQHLEPTSLQPSHREIFLKLRAKAIQLAKQPTAAVEGRSARA